MNTRTLKAFKEWLIENYGMALEQYHPQYEKIKNVSYTGNDISDVKELHKSVKEAEGEEAKIELVNKFIEQVRREFMNYPDKNVEGEPQTEAEQPIEQVGEAE